MDYNFSTELEHIESILNEKLPDLCTSQWKQQQFGSLPPVVEGTHFQPLLAPCAGLVHLGGKRWRPLLLVLCAQAAAGTELPPENAYQLTPLVEFVHTASLIHDDIEDAADMRRGAPAAHITYGLDTALNAGSWLYFSAPECIESADIPVHLKAKLYCLYTQELRRLHLGQAMDIAWHRNNETIPSISEYTAMVRLKTGTLASLAARTGCFAGGAEDQTAATAGEAAADIGIGFQILDDVINLSTGNEGKKRGDDIVEGKKSLPVLLYLSDNPERLPVIASYFTRARSEGINSSAVESCIAELTTAGVLKMATARAEKMIQSACMRFSELFPGSAATEKIATLFTAMQQKTTESLPDSCRN